MGWFVFITVGNTKLWNHFHMCTVVLWTKIVVEFLLLRNGLRCESRRYADVRYLEGSSVHFIWPRVGSDCYLIEAARYLLRMLIQFHQANQIQQGKDPISASSQQTAASPTSASVSIPSSPDVSRPARAKQAPASMRDYLCVCRSNYN